MCMFLGENGVNWQVFGISLSAKVAKTAKEGAKIFRVRSATHRIYESPATNKSHNNPPPLSGSSFFCTGIAFDPDFFELFRFIESFINIRLFWITRLSNAFPLPSHPTFPFLRILLDVFHDSRVTFLIADNVLIVVAMPDFSHKFIFVFKDF